jgi:putative ABC transport system permease protein
VILEILRFALSGLTANKLRSALTTLGITIGVGAVIVLVAVGNGSAQKVADSISSLGANTLTVSSSLSQGGFGGGTQADSTREQGHTLSDGDATALSDADFAPDVKSASPVVTTSSVTATYRGSSHSIEQFVGTDQYYFHAADRGFAKGRSFTANDVSAGRAVVVLGSTVASDLFGSVNPVGKQLEVGGVPFTVAGVLAKSGSSSTGLQDSDDMAVAPIGAVEDDLTGYSSLDEILVQATRASTIDKADTEVTAILNQRHDVTSSSDTDFTVTSQASLRSAASSSERTFTVLLGAVAAISLLVGGIGITNIMLVTVTERTREIGIRKAIGAPRYAILGQFVMEAVALSLIGGLLGVAIGLVGSRFTILGVAPVIVPSSVALALGVSVAIGLFFGSYPANRAARLRPIEALRHD